MATVASRRWLGGVARAWLVAGTSLALLGVTGTASALDPARRLTQLTRKTWNDELPQNTVRAILQTHDGYMWFGTFEGLARFDGVDFAVFDRSRTGDLRGTSVNHLLEDPSGDLWVSTNGGLTRRHNGVFATLTTADGLPSDLVNSTHLGPDGSLWIATDSGLALLRDGRIQRVTAGGGSEPPDARAVEVDASGDLWVTSNLGLYRYRNGRFDHFTRADGLPDDRCWVLLLASDGALWVGTEGGLASYRGGVFTSLTTRDGLPDPFVHAMWEDRNHNLWVGTEDSGLSRLSGGHFETLGERDGLTQNHVRAIYEDREGNLWVGTNGGLNQLRDGKLSAYTTQEGLSHDFARVILESRDGSIWIGTDGGGVSRYLGGTFTTYSVKDGLASSSVRALAEGRDGTLWLGTRDGLDRFDGRKFTHITTRDGLPSNLIRAILEDREGTVWVAAETGGVSRLRDGRITVLTSKDGLAGDRSRALYEDREGNLWIGTYSGMSRYKAGTITTYRKTDGLANNIVFAFTEDRAGNLWIGTDGGLSLLRKGVFTSFTMKTGLADDTVFRILEDDHGYLWMSSNRGISRVAVADLYAVADGRATWVKAQAFNRSDGMRANQCNGVSQPAGWKTRSGELWFPTVKGVVRVDPANLRVNRLPPPVLVESVILDDVPYDPAGRIPVKSGTRNIEIHCAALSFVAPEKISFRFRLEGFDADWVDAGPRRTAYYTNISPGEYTFKVTACNSDGIWNETGASLRFVVPTPLYRAWWMLLLYALALTCLVWVAVKLRLQGLARQNALLEARVTERTQEVELRTREVEEANRTLAEKVHLLEASERRAHESERRALESEQRAIEASRAKTVFLSNMSHELRTPLNSIIGFASIVSERLHDKVDPRIEKFLRNILTSGQHLLRLIHDLLDLSKIEAGHMELFVEPFSLHDVVDSVHTAMRGVAAEQGITIEVSVAPDIPVVTGDPVRVTQILFNLLSNAVKFSPSGATVIMRATQLAAGDSPLGVPTVRVDVVDHGIGMRQEDLAIIFQEFRQVDDSPTRRFQGSGLGLALVRRLLTMHGGDIHVESEPDRGSTFSAFLPVTARTGAARSALAVAERKPAVDGGTARPLPTGKIILVVEPEPEICARLANALQTDGHTVLAAQTAEQALELASSSRPDLISLDLALPGMKGWDLLRELRARDSTRQTPLVVVTGEDPGEAAARADCAAFFSHPVDRVAFLQRIRELLLESSGNGRPATVLVIDDEPDVVEMLRETLDGANTRIVCAASGAEGLALARVEHPDVIVLDLLMPGMNGFEVALRLRADLRTAATPVVVCTAKDITTSDKAMLSGRVTTLIPKGADTVARLAAAIRTVLAHR
jgi:signal transduction histidine kinase/ligand-binding sensor domain-containing protein/CheY-like chemotaxis protein